MLIAGRRRPAWDFTGAHALPMTDDTDTIAGLAGNVHHAANRIRDRFSASDVNVDTHGDGDEVTIRLEFRGFESLEAALDRIDEVARELHAIPETDGINAGVNSEGGYDPKTDEVDERPMGWVNADLIHERTLKAVEPECTCGPDEACDVCGGQ